MRARGAQGAWAATPLDARAAICRAAVAAMVERRQEFAECLAWQMGRPISQGGGEMNGFAERAEFMIRIAPEALADLGCSEKPGFTRFIRRLPLGVVVVLAPWNYPYLTAVNSVVPALMAGNSVVLKHSTQTMLCAEHFAQAFAAAGLPREVFQVVHCTHDVLAQVLPRGAVDGVAFTGSVAGGFAVQAALAGSTAALGLELGGKDPAYVRADADVEHAAINVADGAFYNAGQSCCGVERVYVHDSVYERFLERFLVEARALKLGNPTEQGTTLGPLVRPAAAEHVRTQIRQALTQGARSLVPEAEFPLSRAGTPYLAPQVLVDVHHGMDVMREESFGPVVGIQRVSSDEEAVGLMNDSAYGLTASIWTRDLGEGQTLGDQVNTGTVFLNRCDYLDPELAWTGVKNSGRGCTLSRLGYEGFTRPKSYHLRHL